MKYGLAALAFAVGALAGDYGGEVVYTTEVVTAYTTFCPEATTISHGTWTYCASASETVTVTDCPCTLTRPAVTSTILYTSCPSSGPSSYAPESNAPYPTETPYVNPLVAIYASGGAAATGGAYPSAPYEFTGAAAANNIGGVMVGALAGVVAFAL